MGCGRKIECFSLPSFKMKNRKEKITLQNQRDCVEGQRLRRRSLLGTVQAEPAPPQASQTQCPNMSKAGLGQCQQLPCGGRGDPDPRVRQGLTPADLNSTREY